MDWTRHYLSFEDFAEYNGISTEIVEKYKEQYEWDMDMLEAYLEDVYGKGTYVITSDSLSDVLIILKTNEEDPVRRLKEAKEYLLWKIQQDFDKGKKNEEWIELYDKLNDLIK